MILVTEILGVILLILVIPRLFKMKDKMYKRQGLEINKKEESAFLLGSFTVLVVLGGIYKMQFFFMMSLPFLFWILVDFINFDIELWKQFLKILRR